MLWRCFLVLVKIDNNILLNPGYVRVWDLNAHPPSREDGTLGFYDIHLKSTVSSGRFLWKRSHGGETWHWCMRVLAWADSPAVAPMSSSRRARQRQATGHGVGIFSACIRNIPERETTECNTIRSGAKACEAIREHACALTVADVHLRLTGEEAVFSSSVFTAVQRRSQRNHDHRSAVSFWMFEIINSQINAGWTDAVRGTTKRNTVGFLTYI